MREPEGTGPGHLDIAETAPHTVIDAAADDANGGCAGSLIFLRPVGTQPFLVASEPQH